MLLIVLEIFHNKNIKKLHSALKKKKTLSHAMTWMDFEDTVLSKIRRTKRQIGTTPLI